MCSLYSYSDRSTVLTLEVSWTRLALELSLILISQARLLFESLVCKITPFSDVQGAGLETIQGVYTIWSPSKIAVKVK